MMTSRFWAPSTMLCVLLAACGGEVSGGHGGGGAATTTTSATTTASETGGADGGTTVDKAAACASMFGDALTNAFGRADGTVLAVVQPEDTQCPLPNNDHVILQITMNGAAYRMVINIESSFGDPNVRYLEMEHALPAPAWAEGWHTGLTLDYVNDLGLHTTSSGFTPHPLAELSGIVTDAITIGQKVSVYTTSSGGSSAHKIHRNEGKTDGAIVLDPDSAHPKMLLFHFANQTF